MKRKKTTFEKKMQRRQFATEWGFRMLIVIPGGIIGGFLGFFVGRALS